jgi:uncharacterized membrane protein YvlD (DUF360 family)
MRKIEVVFIICLTVAALLWYTEFGVDHYCVCVCACVLLAVTMSLIDLFERRKKSDKES